MKNKYAKRSRISEGKVRELVRYFAADLTALQAATLSGLNRNTVNRLYRGLRDTSWLPARPGVRCSGSSRSTRASSGHEGQARAWRLRQDRRLRHLRASRPSLHRDRPGLSKPTLQGIGPGRPRAVINSDGSTTVWSILWPLPRRSLFTKGAVHINGIEGGRQGPAGEVQGTFHLLKETEWRYNNRHADKYQTLLKFSAKTPSARQDPITIGPSMQRRKIRRHWPIFSRTLSVLGVLSFLGVQNFLVGFVNRYHP